MTQIRPELSKKNELYINKHAFYSAYHFALQYTDWKAQYAELIGSAQKAVDYDDMPHAATTGDPTARLGIRSSVLSSNIKLVETTVQEACGYSHVAPFLLIGVTQEGATYNYLRNKLRMKCARNAYYQMRRLFYYKLAHKLEEANLKS